MGRAIDGIVTAAVLASACAAAPAGPDPVRSQGCYDREAAPRIEWDALQNPVLRLEDRAVKDAAMRFSDGQWHVFASDINGRDEGTRFRVSHWRAPRLGDLGEPVEIYDDEAVGGFASADITRTPDGAYVLAFNSHTTDVDGTEEDLYVRTGPNLNALGQRQRLAHSTHPADDERLIDTALAHAEIGLVIGYKLGQAFELAYSPQGAVDGEFEIIGQPGFEQQMAPGTGMPGIENYQFLQLDGIWHLLATEIPAIAELAERGFRAGTGVGVSGPQHRTLLFTLEGDPSAPEGWLEWSDGRELTVPQEDWNSPQDGSSDYERQNAAFLCDLTDVDGFYYLLYAGSRELSTFDGRGHAALGIARSRDLETWEIP